MRLVIFGPPGSGKGTQAAELAKRLKLQHINTGQVFRDYFAYHSSFEGYTKEQYAKGILAPDGLVDEIVRRALPKDNYILDGYPRTLNQAKYLDSITDIEKVIVLDVPYHTLKTRIMKRASIENRSDDNEDSIKERFQEYREKTAPLLKYYKSKILLVDGDRSLEEITKEILENL